MVKYEGVKQLTQIFYDLLNENEHLRNFKNSISIGKFVRTSYVPLYKILVSKNLNKNLSETDTYMLNFSNIRIVSFTVSNFVKIFSNNFNSSSSESEFEDLKLFGRQIFENQDSNFGKKPIRSIGLNIDKNLKIRGSLLSFTDIRPVLENTSQHLSINEFYYVGRKNILVAISTENGILVIREQALLNFLKNNDLTIVKTVLKKLLTAYSRIYEKFESVNIREFKDNCYDFSIFNACDALTRHLTVFPNSENKLNDTQYKELKETIIKTIEKNIERLTKNTIFGIHNSQSYSTIIRNILQKRKEVERDVSQKSFQEGMAFGLKIEMLGWRPRQEKFVDESDHTLIWWEKDVNIIPDTFIFKSDRYEIPAKQRVWKITKLFVCQKGYMRCRGTHPNVSGTKVCMGDLRINWGSSYEALKSSLERAETLLDIINFDSAYDSAAVCDLIKTSKKIDFLSDKIQNTPSKIKMIKEVNFDESSDGEEVILPEQKEKKQSKNKIIKVNNDAEIEVLKIDQKTKKSIDIEDQCCEDEDEEVFENSTLESTNNTYEIERETNQSSAYVLSDGNVSPVVRITESSVSNQNNQPVQINRPLIELTDNDIIRKGV